MASLEDISSLMTIDSGESEAFWIRFNCVHNWYLRSSSKSKLTVLISLVENIKDDSYLNILLSSFNFTTDKLMMYSECYSRANYIYDINLKDHNRGLDDQFLTDTIEKNIRWYKTLEPREQITAITELLKISGGTIIKSIYQVLKKRVQENILAKLSTIEDDKNKVEKFDLNQLFMEKKVEEESPDTDVKSKKGKKKKEKKTKKKEKSKPKTPLEADIAAKKKAWEDEMKRYRSSVEGKPNKKGKKGKGSGKASKSSKASSKKSKKNKGQKNLVDQIQMLPIWVVKKIFSYLDAKTLKKAAEVNIYWSYIVEDLAKDKKNMKAVEKVLKKMQKNISELDTTKLKPTGIIEKMTSKEKKLMNLAERGAVAPCIRNVIKSPTENKTLLERAIALSDTSLQIPTDGYQAFPRDYGLKKGLLALPRIVYTESGIFNYGKKPEGGAVTIVELTSYSDINLQKKYSQQNIADRSYKNKNNDADMNDLDHNDNPGDNNDDPE